MAEEQQELSLEQNDNTQEATKETTQKQPEQPSVDVDILETQLEQAKLNAKEMAKYKKDFDGLKERAKTDRLGVLKEFGINPDDVLDDIIGAQSATPSKQEDSNIPKELAEKIAKMEEYVSSLQNKEQTYAQKQAESQVFDQIKEVIQGNKEKFEKSSIFGDYALRGVKKMMEDYTEEYGVRPRKKQIEAFVNEIELALEPELDNAVDLIIGSSIGRKKIEAALAKIERKPTLTNSDSGGTRDYSDISDLPPEQKIVEIAKRLKANQ